MYFQKFAAMVSPKEWPGRTTELVWPGISFSCTYMIQFSKKQRWSTLQKQKVQHMAMASEASSCLFPGFKRTTMLLEQEEIRAREWRKKIAMSMCVVLKRAIRNKVNKRTHPHCPCPILLFIYSEASSMCPTLAKPAPQTAAASSISRRLRQNAHTHNFTSLANLHAHEGNRACQEWHKGFSTYFHSSTRHSMLTAVLPYITAEPLSETSTHKHTYKLKKKKKTHNKLGSIRL